MSPQEVIQRQLDAYNARDLARFIVLYCDDVKLFRPPETEPSMEGKAAVAEFYRTQRFNRPKLRAELLDRFVVGNKVLDHERIHGVRDAPYEVAIVYEVRAGLIRKVWMFSAE